MHSRAACLRQQAGNPTRDSLLCVALSYCLLPTAYCLLFRVQAEAVEHGAVFA
jgi:hypothetical protein